MWADIVMVRPVERVQRKMVSGLPSETLLKENTLSGRVSRKHGVAQSCSVDTESPMHDVRDPGIHRSFLRSVSCLLC